MTQWSPKRLATILLAGFIILTGCSKDDKTDKGGKDGKNGDSPTAREFQAPYFQQIKVVSTDGKAVPKAQILIGDAANQPFADNFVTTDDDGFIAIPAGWTNPATVTISAPGFVRVSYLKQLPMGQQFTIRALEGPRNLELKGTPSGIPTVDYDDVVDFGLVIPSLTRQDLFNFDIGMVLSHQVDNISILGQTVAVPSNVTLPKQKESYFFSFTLNKPDYRLYFNSTGKKSVFTGKGQFPLRDVVSDLRGGKEFYELINYFKITGGSLKPVEITGPSNSANLPANELVFNQSRSFQTPSFAADQILISLALSEYQGSFFPTDVKRFEANQKVNLTTAAGATPFLVAVLKNQSEFKEGPGKDRLSAALMSFEVGVKPSLLQLMKDPKVSSITGFTADAVAPLAGVTPVGSYAVLSQVSSVANGDAEPMEVLNRQWEVYDPEWSTNIQLPAWPNEKPLAGTKRWEISRIGSASLESGKKLDLGPSMFEHSTHATHSSADFK